MLLSVGVISMRDAGSVCVCLCVRQCAGGGQVTAFRSLFFFFHGVQAQTDIIRLAHQGFCPLHPVALVPDLLRQALSLELELAFWLDGRPASPKDPLVSTLTQRWEYWYARLFNMSSV